MKIFLANCGRSMAEKQSVGNVQIYLANTALSIHGEAQMGILAKNKLALSDFKILISYWYFKNKDLDAIMAKHFVRPYPEIFADSGAFSAFNFGKIIDVKDYARWLFKWKHLFTVYANLDVKGDPSAGLKNLEYLESVGLEPLPVFHGEDAWWMLDKILEKYSYIALGGMAGSGSGRSVTMRWLIRCFKLAKGKAVFHGFGQTNWDILKSFPWYSVDSTSWGQGFQFGGVPVFDSRAGRFWKLSLGKTSDWQKHAHLVRSLGFDPKDFADRKRNERTKIAAIGALSYILAARWLQKRWGKIEIPKKPNSVGCKMHLADVYPCKGAGSARKEIKWELL